MTIEAKMIDSSMDKVQVGDLEAERQAVLKRHQFIDHDDPAEKRIIGLLKTELLPTDWAKKTFVDIRGMLVKYFKDSLLYVGSNPQYVHDRTQKLLSEVALRGNSKIVSGEENLGLVPNKSPVFLITNHLGLYKLATVNPQEELGINDVGVDQMYALPLFHASSKPVADKLGDNLYIAAFEFPGEIGKIEKAAGGVIIRLEEEEKLAQDGTEGLQRLIDQTLKFIKKHKNSALSVLPEGRTSGKRGGNSPYDLDNFKTGAFVVAAKLGIPILPVPQYFNPNTGFEVGVLNPIHLSPDLTRRQFLDVANNMRAEMQAWLNQRRAVNTSS